MAQARVVELIYTTDCRGAGTEEDPVRTIHELWTKMGFLVSRHDPRKEKNGELIGSFVALEEAAYTGQI